MSLGARRDTPLQRGTSYAGARRLRGGPHVRSRLRPGIRGQEVTDERPFIEWVGEWCELLRSKGVARWRGPLPHGYGEADIEFFPNTRLAPTGREAQALERFREDIGKIEEPEDALPSCPCGHSLPEHGPHGLCLLGCSPAQCAPAKEATP